MTFKNNLLSLALGFSSCLAAGSAFAAGQPGVPSAWTKIADGVFQRVESNGAVSRQAFGEAGARFDLSEYQDQLNRMLAEGTASAETIANLRTAIGVLQERVAFADASKSSSDAPAALSPDAIAASTGLFGYNNTPTPICAFVAHQMADFRGNASVNPGGGNGEATASIMYYGFNTSVTNYTATFYVHADVTPLGSPMQAVNATTSVTASSLSAPGPTLFTRSVQTTPTAFSVTARTSSYMSIAGCTGGYQSYTYTQIL
jgi:hypothetical protein